MVTGICSGYNVAPSESSEGERTSKPILLGKCTMRGMDRVLWVHEKESANSGWRVRAAKSGIGEASGKR